MPLPGASYRRLRQRTTTAPEKAHPPAKDIVRIKGVVVGAVVRGLDDTASGTERKRLHGRPHET